MPLQHSGSDTAFKTNVKTLMGEVGKSPHVQSRDQALAIAYDVKRRSRASGGIAPALSPRFVLGQEARGMHAGPILSAVAGRTDHHPMNVAAGSYVLPADHVSSLGQGNTASGMAVLNKMFGGAGPYGVGRNLPVRGGAGAPRPPKAMGARAAGGAADSSDAGHLVPINAAGGEYVLSPAQVASVGSGNIKHGHQILDHWVVSNRKKHVKTLSKLPGPAKS